MKKGILLIFTCLVICGIANSQSKVVKVNPLGLTFGSFELGFEHAPKDKIPYELSLLYVSKKDDVNGGDNNKSSGIGVEGKLKFYLSKSKEAPRGLYVAPVITFDFLNQKSKDETRAFTALKGGALFGYQWIFGGGNSGFALDLNFGAQYVSNNFFNPSFKDKSDNILIRAGAGVGYAW